MKAPNFSDFIISLRQNILNKTAKRLFFIESDKVLNLNNNSIFMIEILCYAGGCLFSNNSHRTRISMKHCICWDQTNMMICSGIGIIMNKYETSNFKLKHIIIILDCWKLRPSGTRVFRVNNLLHSFQHAIHSHTQKENEFYSVTKSLFKKK